MFTFASLSASNLRLGDFYNVSNYPSLNKTLGEFKARRKRAKITQGENNPVYSNVACLYDTAGETMFSLIETLY